MKIATNSGKERKGFRLCNALWCSTILIKRWPVYTATYSILDAGSDAIIGKRRRFSTHETFSETGSDERWLY